MTRYPQTDRTVARRAVRAVVTGDMEEIERLYAQDVRVHRGRTPDPRGMSGVRERALTLAAALWDCSFHVVYSVQTGDVVVTRWAADRLHRGWSPGAAPPRGPKRVTGTSVMRISRGQVVDDWTHYEGLPQDEALMEPAG